MWLDGFRLMQVRLINSPLTAVVPGNCLVYSGISVMKYHTLEIPCVCFLCRIGLAGHEAHVQDVKYTRGDL